MRKLLTDKILLKVFIPYKLRLLTKYDFSKSVTKCHEIFCTFSFLFVHSNKKKRKEREVTSTFRDTLPLFNDKDMYFNWLYYEH